MLFFHDISRSLIRFHHSVQRNCGRLSDAATVGFVLPVSEQVFTPRRKAVEEEGGGNVFLIHFCIYLFFQSEHMRSKCLDSPSFIDE